MQCFTVALAFSAATLLCALPAPKVKQVTVHCDVKNEDKEKPGSFKYQLKKDGKVVHERSGWGLEEGWEDNTAHQSSSEDISGAGFDTKGRYTLVVDIDNGKRIDVECEWYVDIVGTDGTVRVSPKNQKFFRNRETHWEITFDINN
ncbi:MAG TPA: hypothetical protein VM510_12165 [Caulifigura sp.]|jgi:hypothetical protein|nr:hypothetical protein [Caulifigura sp.]